MVYQEPFEDDALEQKAWELYEAALEQGSLVPKDKLIEDCRKLAHENHLKMILLGDQLIVEDESEQIA